MAITKDQFQTIEALYNYYNKELFNGELNDCLLNMSRKNGAMGFFAPNRWTNKDGIKIHEISINPDTFNIDDEELHRTIVHEMCHLWQQDLGKPSRKYYHNKEWAQKMIAIGLMPSHNGQVGGKTTGQRMNDYTIEDGLFKNKFDAIVSEKKDDLILPYFPVSNQIQVTVIENDEDQEGEGEGESEPKESKAGKKVRYMCSCENRIWGKPDLRVICADCSEAFEAR